MKEDQTPSSGCSSWLMPEILTISSLKSLWLVTKECSVVCIWFTASSDGGAFVAPAALGPVGSGAYSTSSPERLKKVRRSFYIYDRWAVFFFLCSYLQFAPTVLQPPERKESNLISIAWDPWKRRGEKASLFIKKTKKLQEITFWIIVSFFHVSTPFRKALVDVPVIQFQGVSKATHEQ